MTIPMKTTAQSQAGVVLMFSLIMMVIMTLLVISMLRTGVIELRIGGASQISAQNLANAEAAIWDFMNRNRGNFFHGAVLDVNLSDDFDFTSRQFSHLTNVTLTANEVACTDFAGVGSGNMLGPSALQAVYFDVRADARDPVFAGRTIVNQGIRGILPPGGCS
ncbi:MAG: Tfp pilus assembly protein PilX [Candidatus Accumulibacter cognatus]|uniref:Tfp pilus assembly protein PilX n=3 Tax=Candidatus Accumulibacter TaxID=327159 RepID=A0A080M8W6_9PROT|nr:MAG: Tfp pilus assembly protein PilX [Candidatus Accumulibacter cognatus]